MPRLEDLERTARLLGANRGAAAIARITTRRDVEAALGRETATARLHLARFSLSESRPDLSARTVMTATQAAALTLLAGSAVTAVALDPGLALTLLHGLAGVAFAACVAVRLAAVAARPERKVARDEPTEATLPLYSVLVALHHESSEVDRLVQALAALDWPASRLEIKLVCEADDPATVRAVERAIAGRPQFELARVPASEPRTKPKALNVALPLTSGEFLVLHDAEDQPDPGQLREANAALRNGPADLACVQAPLVVRNGGNDWLANTFALEYGALFRRFLPWLASHRFPIPLGGTSNHFVRARLVEVGAWDPYNVTEDADLGMRLARHGYRVEMLTRPTFEHAPENLPVWFRQRTRWTKGWMQTWLVHMRRPRQLLAELGWRDFAMFQILFLGMLASGFAHPVFLILAGATVVSFVLSGWPTGWSAALFGLDLANAVGGYLAFVALSIGAVDRETRALSLRSYLRLPVYWLLIAAATLRAVVQLARDPHRWEKTPHDMRSRSIPHDLRYRREPEFGEA